MKTLRDIVEIRKSLLETAKMVGTFLPLIYQLLSVTCQNYFCCIVKEAHFRAVTCILLLEIIFRQPKFLKILKTSIRNLLCFT